MKAVGVMCPQSHWRQVGQPSKHARQGSCQVSRRSMPLLGFFILELFPILALHICNEQFNCG